MKNTENPSRSDAEDQMIALKLECLKTVSKFSFSINDVKKGYQELFALLEGDSSISLLKQPIGGRVGGG